MNGVLEAQVQSINQARPFFTFVEGRNGLFIWLDRLVHVSITWIEAPEVTHRPVM